VSGIVDELDCDPNHLQPPGFLRGGFGVSVSASSVSISSAVGRIDCRLGGNARLNSYVEMPIGLSLQGKRMKNARKTYVPTFSTPRQNQQNVPIPQ